MRTLVLADIHSNWDALNAIPLEFDSCIVLGDLVDYGVEPVPCLEWAQKHANLVIRGNHDHAIAQFVSIAGHGGLRRLASVTREHHWSILQPNHLKYLSRLPMTVRFRQDVQNWVMVHASPRDPLDEYVPTSCDAWANRVDSLDADILCVGHTHQPFHLFTNGIEVLNPGSVGQPRDGDWRASYAIVEDGVVSLHRVEYDLDSALRQIRKSGLPDWAIAMNQEILKRGGALTREELNSF